MSDIQERNDKIHEQCWNRIMQLENEISSLTTERDGLVESVSNDAIIIDNAARLLRTLDSERKQAEDKVSSLTAALHEIANPPYQWDSPESRDTQEVRSRIHVAEAALSSITTPGEEAER